MNIGSKEIFKENTKPYLRQVEYLERNNKQWIDANFNTNINTSCCVECEFLTQSQPGQYSGFGFFGNGNSRFQVVTQNETSIFVGIGVNATIDWQQGFHTYELDIKNLVAKVDGKLLSGQFSRPTDYLQFYLFRSNRRDDAHPPSKIRIKRCKLYDNARMVRDLIPVIAFNGEACMYDNVSEQFFYNCGEGKFAYGEYLKIEV